MIFFKSSPNIKFIYYRMLRFYLLVIPTIIFYSLSFSQANIDSVKTYNQNLFLKLQILIELNGSFKEAVFLSEEAFENRLFSFDNYLDAIKTYAKLSVKKGQTINLKSYRSSDSTNYIKNTAIFKTITRPVIFQNDSVIFQSIPFKYNFSDPQGDKDFTNTFVTKLLVTHEGNCRSLVYLYKILADEVGAKCWLSLAPNHIYIRNYSKQIGWYNTELTSGSFPTDAWIAASGYVNTDAIRSGLYMDTLSNRQAIGLCILDLLHGYIRQTNNYTDGFVLKGCDLVLKYHPVNPMALLLKAEALKRLYAEQKQNNDAMADNTFFQMQDTYTTLIKLGYREMPKKAYQQWLANLAKEKEKFQNQDLPKISTLPKTDTISTTKPLKAF